ncbi:MAG: ABC transporter substrate binding protein [Phycisphaerae bacterium]|nr:ABC transporter substrate binding protein [Phycisphaerae bacterium]
MLASVRADNAGTAKTPTTASKKQPAHAPPSKILVVRTSDARPYILASTGAAARLAKMGHSVETVALADVTKNFRKRADGVAATVAVGTGAADWICKNKQPTDKLIYCMVAGSGQASLKGPNVSGVSTDVPIASQFALIARALPRARVIGMLFSSKSKKSVKHLAAAKSALPKGWRIVSVDVARHKSHANAMFTLLIKEIDIVWTSPDSSVFNSQSVRYLLLTALKKKVPVFGFSAGFVRIGAMFGVSVNPGVQGEQAADMTDRVLQVASGASGVETRAPAVMYGTVVNLIVANRIGVNLPEKLVKSADTVYRPKSKGDK